VIASLVILPLFSRAEDSAENQMKFLRLAPERASFVFQTRLGGSGMRRKNSVSFASFLQVPILLTNSFFETASSASQ
jgi:hypothetical protein